jgi:hypothetical protein
MLKGVIDVWEETKGARKEGNNEEGKVTNEE